MQKSVFVVSHGEYEEEEAYLSQADADAVAAMRSVSRECPECKGTGVHGVYEEGTKLVWIVMGPEDGPGFRVTGKDEPRPCFCNGGRVREHWWVREIPLAQPVEAS